MKKSSIIAVDMDCILVNMLPYWLDIYNEMTGESIESKDITEYEIRKFVKEPNIFDQILHEKGFFSGMKPMPGAVKYMRKLIEEGYDIVILTQPPRKSAYAVKEKTDWIEKYFPDYDLSNIVFAHRKELVDADLLFDDKPSHLIKWKHNHPNGITATIEYPYNKHCVVDVKYTNQRTAWKEFYDFVVKSV